MRVLMVCALGVALASVWAMTVGGQSKAEAGKSPPSETSVSKEPSVLAALPSDGALAQERRSRSVEFVPLSQADAKQLGKFLISRQSEGEADSPATCGHIVIYVAPRNLDARMIIQVPKEYLDAAPAYPGVGACGRDIRTSFNFLEGPAPVLPRPGRNDRTLVDAKKRQNPN